MLMWVIGGLIVVIVVVAIFAMRGRSRQVDGMSSFRKQIDALSPEARRPVVDQVQRAAKDDDPSAPTIDTKPAVTPPATAQSVDAQPVETQPAETQPAGGDEVTTGADANPVSNAESELDSGADPDAGGQTSEQDG